MGIALKDVDVRRAAYARLLHHATRCPDTLVVDELGIDHGACRIDIAVINGHIRGLEIKAEADTLTRLPHQVAAYGDVVDKASLIVARRHLDAALPMIPDWWGVILANRGAGGGVIFGRVREERVNRHPNPVTLSRLLWRPEVQQLLRELGHTERVLRAPREVLYHELAAAMPRRDLARRIREILKHREAWRDRPRPS
ncbi:MAG: sce7726 family protein [Phenylobacterium sp.]|uniref:sce7726 family protein n=1 Tax=Phenylobacterium sp. TaxID=1871053 RepID=UPI002735D5BE|nr:sce7726 family protein [Phenylobacterium sp.]MDP3746630.1 sce7726 family protein [Phenylobacterium sp.]